MDFKDNEFLFFYQTSSPFSQFHPCNFIDWDQNKFNCAEQWMMYCKALLHTNSWSENILISDQASKLCIKKYSDIVHNKNIMICQEILACTDPKKIKSFGRRVIGFDDTMWNGIKEHVVKMGNILKFMQNPTLKKVLLDTGDKILVEASPYDKIWGIGFDANSALNNKHKWGQNLLGLALMNVRNKLIYS
jgi:ribA/ribD-fused uncharacterized protein